MLNENLTEPIRELSRQYNKLYGLLTSKDESLVKNELVKTNLKGSLVSGTLLKRMEELTAEKDTFRIEINNLKNENINLKSSNSALSNEINELKNEIKYKFHDMCEFEQLNRNLKKEIENLNEKIEIEKREKLNYDILNTELELSRKIVMNKNEWLSKEIESLKEAVSYEKARGDKVEQQAKMISNLESEMENMKKKLTIKDRNLDTLNEELANLLKRGNNKSNLNMDYNAADIDRLYKMEIQKNQYLMSQIRNHCNKDSFESIEHTLIDQFNGTDSYQFDDTLNKYKKIKQKYMKTKSQLNNKKDKLNIKITESERNLKEIGDLKRNIAKLKNENQLHNKQNEEINSQLVKKLEDLMDKNLNYQNELIKVRNRISSLPVEEKFGALNFRSKIGTENQNVERNEDIANDMTFQTCLEGLNFDYDLGVKEDKYKNTAIDTDKPTEYKYEMVNPDLHRIEKKENVQINDQYKIGAAFDRIKDKLSYRDNVNYEVVSKNEEPKIQTGGFPNTRNLDEDYNIRGVDDVHSAYNRNIMDSEIIRGKK